MQGTGHTFISLTPSQEAALIPHPSCCHVNHRPTGSLLFTLVSLPPKFDYCNCLLTVCSAGFHTSSSCQGQEQGAASLILKRGTLPTHRDNTIASCLSVTPQAPDLCANPKIAPILYTSWSSYSVSLVKPISLEFSPWIFVVKFCPLQLSKVTVSLV